MTVETMSFLQAAARFIKAAGKRVAEADEIELAELLKLQDVLDQAIQDAVMGIHSGGRSWAYIATATGTTRQAAFQRWGKPAGEAAPLCLQRKESVKMGSLGWCQLEQDHPGNCDADGGSR